MSSSVGAEANPPAYSVPRKHPRIPLTVEIRCDGAGRAERFISRDVSSGGVFLYTTRVYPMNAKVQLSFFIPYHSEQIKAVGRVARHSQDAHSGLVDGMGIEFEDISEGARTSIDRYINATKKD